MNHPKHSILILDFGSQYTQLIARRIREIGVFSQIEPFDISVETIKQINPKGIILSGSHSSVNDNPMELASDIFELNIPILGICYGMQLLAKNFSGKVKNISLHEYGSSEIECTKNHQLFKGFLEQNQKSIVWMSHADQVMQLPTGFKTIAQSKTCPIAAMANDEKQFFAIQFHPEVTHSKNANQIFTNFVYGICECENNWNISTIAENMIKNLKSELKNNTVLLALSGGVDSSVLAVLLQKAIGKNLKAFFINNGLLRLNEAEQVMETFKPLGIDLTLINAQDEFFNALKNTTEPEAKRKAIGKTFIDIFNQTANRFNNIEYLAQGTIYPDVVESAKTKSGKATVIKSHHNVGGLPEKMQLKLVEPLRDLFKDEVRKLGLELGLDKNIVYRHPFPGPGLAVRILGEVTDEKCQILKKADDIFISELRNHNLYDKVAQAFVVFLGVKSVGVVGDARRYGEVVSLRAVETTDFMTAKYANLPYEFLEKVSNRIVNEISQISRVVYDISSKPPATIEWE